MRDGWDAEDIQLTVDQIIPNGSRMLVRRRREADTTKGGIIIPETARTMDYIAYVGAVGPDVVNFQVGDWVLLGKWQNTSMNLLANPQEANTEKAYELWFLISEEDVFGKLKEAPKDNGIPASS